MPPSMLRAIQTALLDAFSLSKFDNLLQQRLDKKREHYSVATNLRDIIADVLDSAEKENWLDDLIEAAHSENPSHNQLKLVAEKFQQTNQVQERLDKLESRLLLSRMGGDVSAEISTLGDLGLAQLHANQRDKGLQNLRLAADLAKQNGQTRPEMVWSNALGFYLIDDAPHESAQLLQRAISLAKQQNDLDMQIVISGNLGQCFLTAGLYDAAAGHYKTCIELIKQLNDDIRIGRAHYNLGNVYYYQKKWDAARESYETAVSQLNATSDPLEQHAKNMLAKVMAFST